MRRLLALALLTAATVTACAGSSSGGAAGAAASSPAAIGLCDSIRLGAAVDVALLESGCSDPDRSMIVSLNHTKCRGGSDFGTFDLKDVHGHKTDQLFAYNGTWHSTDNEGALYRRAFDECL